MTPKEYQEYVAKKQAPSPIVKDTVLAFFLPTLCGVLCCLLVNFTVGLFA